MPRISTLARSITPEGAFTILAKARQLKAAGKDVVELEIGDSPFPTPPNARAAGIAAIEAGRTGYGPSLGLPELREAAARWANRELRLPFTVGPEHIIVASGAKPFEQYVPDALLEPGDGVLVFSPYFPSYLPNLLRAGARPVLAALRPEDHFRPRPEAVAAFLDSDPRPRAIWLNSPHNPTGGVAAPEDLAAIADLVRHRQIVIFSDEPYCDMVWTGRHHTVLAQPDMLETVVAAYTFSKSYSMSGWRIGFAIAHPEVVEAIGRLVNVAASCSPPFVQLAAAAALDHDADTRDADMARFRAKVERLVGGLSIIDEIQSRMPDATFYAFPDVRAVCNRLGLSSQGLALFLLEGADDRFGVACLGGECFGQAGAGFLRFSCAEPDDRIDAATAFVAKAIRREDRARAFVAARPELALAQVDGGVR